MSTKISQTWLASHTGARGIPVGYGTLVLVYVLLIAAVAWILWRLARKPLELEPSLSAAEVD